MFLPCADDAHESDLGEVIKDKEITINKLRKELALLTQTNSNNTWAEYDDKGI